MKEQSLENMLNNLMQMPQLAASKIVAGWIENRSMLHWK
jgi:hypothetical protein